ncbi:MAG: DUF4058 family protein [bacterium]|nr:DUF4058 family protein [bacterium]
MSVANPFPGMHPYLEDPALWDDGPHTLISVVPYSPALCRA